ncbi:hypothetical protein [Bifidobacterium felsineum]|uniref:hypothetical protein n=1 Tax=Bifidobacterium felsineum TaxID=2045440 RepID=UPI001BDDA0FA|nr:hypothetical protein [Bifidobacterium felsineum]MBT1164566.1 hypothetical protein [Bifidobacterium felsineum]
MVIDLNGMSHVAKGRPDGGQYENKNGGGDGGDVKPPAPPLGGNPPDPTGNDDGNGGDRPNPYLMLATAGMRGRAIRERTNVKSREETQGLLREADHVEFGPNGAILYDGQGNILFREDPTVPGLDKTAMHKDPRVRAAIRDTFRGTLDEYSAADRRSIIRNANRYAGAYERRLAVDHSPNRRYLPADTIARSLARRKDKDSAIRIMRELHYEDATASGNVIRAGYPNDKASAWAFINHTKIRRDKQGKPVHGEWTDRDGKHHEGVMPEPRGAAGRAYLRMLYQPTDGVPSQRDTARMLHVFHRMDDDEPRIQAQTFWNLCYGNPHKGDRWEDVNFTVGLIGQRSGDREGARILQQCMDDDGGSGNVARMLAYRKCMTRDAAVHFLAMTAGDDRKAHTQYDRSKGRGAAKTTFKPRRLTEMRSFIHAVYSIPSREVDEYAATHDLKTGELKPAAPTVG